MLQEAKEVCPTTTRHLIGEGALLVDVREPRVEKWDKKGFPIKGQLPAASASAGGCC